MKKPIKIYLEQKDLIKLLDKAKACGINGRGYLSHYISKVANEPIIFVNADVLKLLQESNNK
jgi:hypothetical protein